MTDASKLSRREWFRLRVPRKNQLLGHAETGSSNNVLKPIEHPPNHDGMNLSDLPPMREARLSAVQIEALIRDIAELAADVQLMQHADNSNRATARNANSAEQLDFAKAALLSGTVPRIQIRYRWNGKRWIDTLKVESGTYHLVRIAHDRPGC